MVAEVSYYQVGVSKCSGASLQETETYLQLRIFFFCAHLG